MSDLYNELFGNKKDCCKEPLVNTGHGFSLQQKVCYLEEIVGELGEDVEGFQGQIDSKEDSSNITGSRRLSENGDFSGTLNGVAVSQVLTEIDSNGDQIEYLTGQFEEGQTGLVVDGGFFGDDIIDKGYDGGVW